MAVTQADYREDEKLLRLTRAAINKVMDALVAERARISAKIGDAPEPQEVASQDPSKPRLRPAAATAVWDGLVKADREAKAREAASRTPAPWEKPVRPTPEPVGTHRLFQQSKGEGPDEKAARMAQQLADQIMSLIVAAVRHFVHGKHPEDRPASKPSQRPAMQPDRSF
jgi:hypothetical protein